MSQRGAIKLPVLIAVVLGLGFAASAYLNIAQNQRANQDTKLLQGEITDLKYQVGQDKLASNTSPSPSPSASPTPSADATPEPSPTQTPAVLGASTKTAVTTEPANLRSQATATAGLVVPSKIPTSTSVTITGAETNGYWPVTVNGSAGYIVNSALSIKG